MMISQTSKPKKKKNRKTRTIMLRTSSFFIILAIHNYISPLCYTGVLVPTFFCRISELAMSWEWGVKCCYVVWSDLFMLSMKRSSFFVVLGEGGLVKDMHNRWSPLCSRSRRNTGCGTQVPEIRCGDGLTTNTRTKKKRKVAKLGPHCHNQNLNIPQGVWYKSSLALGQACHSFPSSAWVSHWLRSTVVVDLVKTQGGEELVGLDKRVLSANLETLYSNQWVLSHEAQILLHPAKYHGPHQTPLSNTITYQKFDVQAILLTHLVFCMCHCKKKKKTCSTACTLMHGHCADCKGTVPKVLQRQTCGLIKFFLQCVCASVYPILLLAGSISHKIFSCISLVNPERAHQGCLERSTYEHVAWHISSCHIYIYIFILSFVYLFFFPSTHSDSVNNQWTLIFLSSRMITLGSISTFFDVFWYLLLSRSTTRILIQLDLIHGGLWKISRGKICLNPHSGSQSEKKVHQFDSHMFLFLFFYFEPLPHPFFFFLLKKKNHLHHQDTTVSHQLSQLWVPGGDLPCIGKPSCTNILPELSDQLARVHARFQPRDPLMYIQTSGWTYLSHPDWLHAGADQLVEHLYSSLRLLGEFEMTILTHCPKDGHTFHRPLATYNVYLFPEIGLQGKKMRRKICNQNLDFPVYVLSHSNLILPFHLFLLLSHICFFQFYCDLQGFFNLILDHVGFLLKVWRTFLLVDSPWGCRSTAFEFQAAKPKGSPLLIHGGDFLAYPYYMSSRKNFALKFQAFENSGKSLFPFTTTTLYLVLSLHKLSLRWHLSISRIPISRTFFSILFLVLGLNITHLYNLIFMLSMFLLKILSTVTQSLSLLKKSRRFLKHPNHKIKNIHNACQIILIDDTSNSFYQFEITGLTETSWMKRIKIKGRIIQMRVTVLAKDMQLVKLWLKRKLNKKPDKLHEKNEICHRLMFRVHEYKTEITENTQQTSFFIFILSERVENSTTSDLAHLDLISLESSGIHQKKIIYSLGLNYVHRGRDHRELYFKGAIVAPQGGPCPSPRLRSTRDRMNESKGLSHECLHPPGMTKLGDTCTYGCHVQECPGGISCVDIRGICEMLLPTITRIVCDRQQLGSYTGAKSGFVTESETCVDINCVGLQCPVVLKPPGNMCQWCPLSELRILHSGKRMNHPPLQEQALTGYTSFCYLHRFRDPANHTSPGPINKHLMTGDMRLLNWFNSDKRRKLYFIFIYSNSKAFESFGFKRMINWHISNFFDQIKKAGPPSASSGIEPSELRFFPKEKSGFFTAFPDVTCHLVIIDWSWCMYFFVYLLHGVETQIKSKIISKIVYKYKTIVVNPKNLAHSTNTCTWSSHLFFGDALCILNVPHQLHVVTKTRRSKNKKRVRLKVNKKESDKKKETTNILGDRSMWNSIARIDWNEGGQWTDLTEDKENQQLRWSDEENKGPSHQTRT
ncbi:hypothetical protein VP01_571g1 [Puccinia sorghi]|uniref:Uncharacterized protein n=1 Tax=Puccinia sorghi TaxID=27349 RepID=A0A0L6UKP3_9BASI|nr:hypothetical protein VP01_571g1 [Puccinia sorghi]